MLRKFSAWFSLVAVVGLLAACNGSDSDPNTSGGDEARTYPLKAMATIGMVGDIVTAVAGDKAEVTVLLGPGVDPHLYAASRDDVATMMESELVFYNGLMLEGKMSDALVKVARSKVVVPVTEELEKASLLEPEDFEGHYDPHVWMDPRIWEQAVDVVAATFAEYDPANADYYRANAAAYKGQIAALYAYGEKSLATIPDASRVLITSHDAFNYLGRAFNLEVMGVQGLSTESEAGVARRNELVDLIVDRKITAIFVESSVAPDSIEALVQDAATRGHTVVIGGELFSDAMGDAGTYEGTYIGMIDHNVTTITRALGGEAPEKGMQGKLSK